jgi:serralysin
MHTTRLIAIIVLLAALGAAAAPAAATTVRAGATQFAVTGDPGEVNRLNLRYDLDREMVRVADRVPLNVEVRGGGPCTATTPRDVECPFPAGDSRRRFLIDLGDRDDRLQIVTDQRGPVSPEIDVGIGLFAEVRDGPGNDRASSIPTTTFYVAGPGHDVLTGAARATPSGGNDTITGTEGPDTLDGGAGRDVIRGGLGADLIRGGTGNDRLFGQSGQDRLFGGLGNDFLRGGTARDLLNGGPGRDTQIQN